MVRTVEQVLLAREITRPIERDRSVTCRLSEGERTIAEALAAKWGISVASLTRRLLTGLATLVVTEEAE